MNFVEDAPRPNDLHCKEISRAVSLLNPALFLIIVRSPGKVTVFNSRGWAQGRAFCPVS
jgi:hypothetical protein